MEAQSNSTHSNDKTVEKRADSKPELVAYGSVSEFTRGPAGSKADSQEGRFS